MFHLSLTVMLSLSTRYSFLKLSKCFRMLALSALFLMNILRLVRHLRLGEMLISIIIVRIPIWYRFEDWAISFSPLMPLLTQLYK